MQRANDSQGTVRVSALAVIFALVAACSSSQSVVGEPQDVGVVDVQNDLPSIDRPAEAATDVAVDRADAPADITDASDAPPGCRTNADCVPDGGDAGGATMCDMTTGRCVGCIPSADMCPGSQHCDPTVMQCVPGCHSDEGCVADPGSDAGSDAGPVSRRTHCDPMVHTCAECVTDAHCGAGQLCVGSICVAGCDAMHACPTGQTCCANACVDPQSNIANCGMCGTRCMVPNATPACMNGSCAVGTCNSPFADCDMMASTGCETDTLASLDNCGGCGMAVPTRDHATRTCTAGRPGFTCEMGFADCNGVADDGCEVNTASDATHCGSCSTLCNPPNATSACTMGHCTIAMCNTGFGDCDTNPTNGCEVNTNTSSDHCSMCGHSCPSRPNAFPGCIAGTCVISCVAGFQDCNGSDTDGCEVDIRADPRNCGACRRSCTLSNATAGCAMGDCTLAMCNTGFANCDMMVSNGCEVNTQVDESNCGMCGMVCRVAGGTPVCRTGACGVSRCDMGLEDCDMSATNGCEINTQTDVNNCGGCGARCVLPHATASCAVGHCAVAMCDAGFADCNMNPTDGCEVDTTTSAAHCGGCGRACVPTNATGGCAASVCAIACNPGFGNCDMSGANGCEVDLRTSAANCGACGHACVTGTTCQGGLCTRFPSTGAEGAFSPTASVTLTPGVHNYTTITVPAGVVVRTTVPGVLDLRATGDVTIAGTITVTGGGGGGGGDCICGAGGETGSTVVGGRTSGGGACTGGAGMTGPTGENGTNVGGGRGGVGGGGGAGATWGGGGGGGGISGGVGGTGSEMQGRGGNGAGTEVGGGGTTLTNSSWGQGTPPTGGTIAAACYSGGTGSALPTDDGGGGSAGGGGSIGATASADRAVAETTFRPGSGGGGGGGGSDGPGCDDGYSGGGGGGGGGGALRLATTTVIAVAATGVLTADGGPGGITTIATDDGTHDNGGSGGGGSGGVVFLYSPRMTVAGRVTAVGGAGGDFFYPSRSARSTGGTGGLGRVRISVDNVTAGACALGGMFNPPLGSGCATSSNVCQAFVTPFPN